MSYPGQFIQSPESRRNQEASDSAVSSPVRNSSNTASHNQPNGPPPGWSIWGNSNKPASSNSPFSSEASLWRPLGLSDLPPHSPGHSEINWSSAHHQNWDGLPTTTPAVRRRNSNMTDPTGLYSASGIRFHDSLFGPASPSSQVSQQSQGGPTTSRFLSKNQSVLSNQNASIFDRFAAMTELTREVELSAGVGKLGADNHPTSPSVSTVTMSSVGPPNSTLSPSHPPYLQASYSQAGNGVGTQGTSAVSPDEHSSYSGSPRLLSPQTSRHGSVSSSIWQHSDSPPSKSAAMMPKSPLLMSPQLAIAQLVDQGMTPGVSVNTSQQRIPSLPGSPRQQPASLSSHKFSGKSVPFQPTIAVPGVSTTASPTQQRVASSGSRLNRSSASDAPEPSNGRGYTKLNNNSSPKQHSSLLAAGSSGASGAGNAGLNKANPGRKNFEIVRSPLLEEFRAHRSKSYTLGDFKDHFVEFCGDQHGSRFIQERLKDASVEDRNALFDEISPSAYGLITDVFGNYVIQKMFELGSLEHKLLLAEQITGQVLPLSLQMYGCRVVQKAIEYLPQENRIPLVMELQGHVIRCVKHQNGNHVIQKTIEFIPCERIKFITDAFHGQVYELATHPYGCRVIQRMLEHCDTEEVDYLLGEIHKYSKEFVQDQFGNYVIQHVIEKGAKADCEKIIMMVQGSVVTLSRHKFASNVVERCIVAGTAAQRNGFVDQIIGEDNTSQGSSSALAAMIKDQFANYVIQKLLDVTHGSHHDRLVEAIKPHLQAVKKYSYGKHLASIEKLLALENKR